MAASVCSSTEDPSENEEQSSRIGFTKGRFWNVAARRVNRGVDVFQNSVSKTTVRRRAKIALINLVERRNLDNVASWIDAQSMRENAR